MPPETERWARVSLGWSGGASVELELPCYWALEGSSAESSALPSATGVLLPWAVPLCPGGCCFMSVAHCCIAVCSQVFQNFDRMARQDDEERRKELEERMRREEEAAAAAAEAAEREPVPAPVQEVEVNSTTATAADGPVEPPGQLGAMQEAALGSREDAEPPGSDTAAAQASREPPAPPK